MVIEIVTDKKTGEKRKIRDAQELEEVFQNRLRQFDNQRWKYLTIINEAKNVYFYAAMVYDRNKDDIGTRNEIKLYLFDKEGYEEFKKKNKHLLHRGVELLNENENSSAFFVGDIINIDITSVCNINESYDVNV